MKGKRLKITGIIGDPIAHSLSPAMQNAAFRKAGLPFIYLPFHVLPSGLGRFIKKARTWGLTGFNVTIPHKEKIMRYLDSISPEARTIGAVNTVLLRGGKLIGFNTDAAGYLRSLKTETGFRPKGKRILILGSGGATRAVLYALAQAGAREIILCNRTSERARGLAKEFQKKFRRVSIRVIGSDSLSSEIQGIDLLVNATSVGLKGTKFKNLPIKILSRKAIVSDLVYRPAMTPLLREARRRRLKIHPGLGMLLQQGVLSFKLWTGKTPNLGVMKKALLDALR